MVNAGSVGIFVGLSLALAFGGTVRAEPVGLGDPQLDSIAAGGVTPPFGFDGVQVDRSTQITTQISMPMSTAIAVCLFCSGNASAVAIANAIGLGQANANALSTGQGNSLALSNAIGPYLLMLAPTDAPPPQRAPSRGGAGRR